MTILMKRIVLSSVTALANKSSSSCDAGDAQKVQGAK